MNIKKYDVAICGGGIAGVAAAIAAARHGMNTALIEKQCLLGGLATSGLIYIYLPLCDGFGKQVTYGLAEELLQNCTAYGPFDPPEKWDGPKDGNPGIAGDRFQCCFSPAGFSLTLDKMLEEAGVDLWLDTCVIGAYTVERRLESITAFNTSGSVEIRAKCFVDATGGAFVTRMAGGKVFYSENYITPWFMEMSEAPEVYHFTESLHIQFAGTPGGGAPRVAVCGSGRETTDFIRRSWKLIRERYDRLPDPAHKKTYPVHLPAMPQIRKIARINAVTTLANADRSRHFADSIGTIGDWRAPAPAWEAPFGMLLPRDVRNVLAAGRCIGARDNAWEVFRVIPAAAMTGEAAGIAAGLSVRNNISPDVLKVECLQQELAAFRSSVRY
jgi:hypothetical protein